MSLHPAFMRGIANAGCAQREYRLCVNASLHPMLSTAEAGESGVQGAALRLKLTYYEIVIS